MHDGKWANLPYATPLRTIGGTVFEDIEGVTTNLKAEMARRTQSNLGGFARLGVKSEVKV